MNATVYRFYAENGDLLYVGCTTRLMARIGEHTAGRPWWETAARATFEHFASRDEALAAEARAIAHENPVHNSAGRIALWPTDKERGERRQVAEERQQRAMDAWRSRRMYLVPDLHCTNCPWRGRWIVKGKRPEEVACPACALKTLAGTTTPEGVAA